MSAVVVVTGGRYFSPAPGDRGRLMAIMSHMGAVAVFSGDATGADRFAASAAREVGIPVHTVPALWNHQGRKAGPVRNARMLQWAVLLGAELRLPVLVLALPGGVGTADMVRRAKGRDVDVVPFSDGGTP